MNNNVMRVLGVLLMAIGGMSVLGAGFDFLDVEYGNVTPQATIGAIAVCAGLLTLWRGEFPSGDR
jgi:hypothetical protein